jgi:hypothetical protein
MKFYRFMSMKEFNKMASGADIIGKKSFEARTTSTGVCFLSEQTLCKDDDHKATINVEQAYEFLCGIVSDDIVVEFECRQEMTESYGIYASIFGTTAYFATMVVTEYCTPSYNRENMIPVRYGMIDDYYRIEWHPFN